MNKFNITTYKFKWDGTEWYIEPPGCSLIKEKLDNLEKYLTFSKKQSMSRYEVRLYEWILKKQYKADPIIIHDEDNTHIEGYYLGYYNPTRKPIIYREDEYAKEQQRYRARLHS
jgi:hypothetical protein